MNKCVCAWALKTLINLVGLCLIHLWFCEPDLVGNVLLSMANSKLLPMQLCSVRLSLDHLSAVDYYYYWGCAWSGLIYDPSTLGCSMRGGYLRSLFSWLELGETLLFRRKVSNWSPWTGDHCLFMTAEVAKVTNFRWIFPPFWQVRSAKWCISLGCFLLFGGPVIQSDEFLSLTCPFIGIDVCIDSTFRWKLRCFRGIIRRSCALLF